VLEVEEQLRRYGAAVEAQLLRQGSPENEVRLGEMSARHVPRAGRRVRALTVCAATFVVILVVALVVRSVDDRGTSRVVSNPAATPEQLADGWVRVPNAIGPNSFVNDATSGPSGFVAVGYNTAPEGSVTDPTTPAIWRSDDGAVWSQVPAAGLPGNVTAVDAITSWRDEFWASATSPDGTEFWNSSDGGRTWNPQGNVPAALSHDRLVADSLGLVAYGDNGVAVSPDGHDWQQGDLTGEVKAVVRHGADLFALVGEPGDVASGDHAVFTSTDAIHWTRGADLGLTAPSGGSTLTSWNGELWATTPPETAGASTQVWRSPDGKTWTLDSASVPAGAWFDTLTPTGSYLVATGVDATSRPGGWVTADGDAWTSMPELNRQPGGRLNIAASNGTTLVALSTSELKDVYMWHAPPAPAPTTSVDDQPPVTERPAVVPSGVGEEISLAEVPTPATMGAVLRSLVASGTKPISIRARSNPPVTFFRGTEVPSDSTSLPGECLFVESNSSGLIASTPPTTVQQTPNATGDCNANGLIQVFHYPHFGSALDATIFYGWSVLPAGTAYVTYRSDALTAWEVPLSGHVVFPVPTRPAAGTLDAYNHDGELLQEVSFPMVYNGASYLPPVAP